MQSRATACPSIGGLDTPYPRKQEYFLSHVVRLTHTARAFVLLRLIMRCGTWEA